jgi:thymidylate synthase (FAD)
MIEVELIAVSRCVDGSDDEALVVNAARVSFNKRIKQLGERDDKLLNFLARNDHWTPYGHPHVTFRVAAPLFVARQLGKHQVGFVWNEVSRRYVDVEPSYYRAAWRWRSPDKKQGSAGLVRGWRRRLADAAAGVALAATHGAYRALLRLGVAPELARVVLPQATMTEWFWTGSLYGWARVVRLRRASDAQAEAGDVAALIDEHLRELYPLSWPKLVDDVK